MFSLYNISSKNKVIITGGLTVALLALEYYFHFDSEIKVNGHFVRGFILASIWLIFIIAMYMKPKPVIKTATLVAVAMTGFGFVMVPIYNVFCDVTGLNGKIDLSVAAATPDGVDEERTITVEFIVNYNAKMPWSFMPQHHSVKIHPGELASTGYFASNPTRKNMVAQAIPSISPAKASRHFKKVECFCFSSQQLGPGETKNLALRFYLDKDIPKDVQRVTLAYTLFDITDKKQFHRLPHPS